MRRSWTSPRPGTLGAFAPCTALSHNRVRPSSGPYATQSETPKESVAPCPRELTGENSPHIYRGEKTGKPHQQNAIFWFFTLLVVWGIGFATLGWSVLL